MEKLEETSFRCSIPRTKLFINDIEAVIAKLRRFDLEVEITDSDNKYDSLEDIIEHKGKNPKEISLRGKSKGSSFDLLYLRISDRSSLLIINGKPELVSLGYELEKFLKDRQTNWLYSVFNSYYSKINIILNLVLLFGFWLYSRYTETEFNYQLITPIIGFWLLILLYSELNPMTNSNIELVKKHELSIYQRNKDKILIGIILALLTAFIALIFKK